MILNETPFRQESQEEARQLKTTITRFVTGCIALGGTLGILHEALASFPCQYDVLYFHLEACGGNGCMVVTGFNDRPFPDFVGYYSCSCFGTEYGFHYRNGVFTTMPNPPGTSTVRMEYVNNIIGPKTGLPHMLGYSSGSLLYRDGVWTRINPLPGYSSAPAHGLNDGNVVCGGTGSANNPKIPNSAYIWQDGTLTLVETPYGPHDWAFDLNSKGQVVGDMGPAHANEKRAFLWNNGQAFDLGVIPGGYTAKALAISEDGMIVGNGRVPSKNPPGYQLHGWWWKDGTMHLFDLAPGTRGIGPRAVESGWISGLEVLDSGAQEAFVWRNGVMKDPEDLLAIDPPLDLNIALVNARGDLLSGSSINGSGAVLHLIRRPRNGDVNCDGNVNIDDLLGVINQWGPCTFGQECPADLIVDDTVNVDDLLDVINGWNL